MRFILTFVVVLLLAYGESTALSLPLVMFSLVLISLYDYEKKGKVFLLAMLTGLFVDVLQVRILGTTSTIFLIILFVIFLYKRKVIGKNPIFVGMAIFLSSLLYTYVTYHEFMPSLWGAFVLTFVTLVGIWLFKPILPALLK